MRTSWLGAVVLVISLVASGRGVAQPLTWSLAGGSAGWPSAGRDCITSSMNEAVDVYNRYGFFEKHDTANYNAGVPTAQSNYDGWIDFGGSCNTRVAIHEIAHTLGTGTYWAFSGGAWDANSAAGKLVKLFDGQGAVLNTGGTHFWPYGLNYDNEDGPANRERHCKLLSAFRFDMGIVVDSDKDGLPDDWETFHFTNLNEGADADPDADGITNLDEYASDSDPKEASPIADGKTYVLRNQVSKRVLTLAASSAEGTQVVLRDVDRGPAQQWTAHYLGGGFYRLTPADSALVLEVPGTDTASGLPLRLAKWTNALQQQWRVASGPGADANYFQLSNHETGRVADGLDGADGASVQQYPFLGNIPQQFWHFEAVVTAGEGDAGSDASTSHAAADSGGPVVNGVQSDGAIQDAFADAGEADASSDAAISDAHDGATPKRSGCSCSIVDRSQPAAGSAWLAVGLACIVLARVRRKRAAGGVPAHRVLRARVTKPTGA